MDIDEAAYEPNHPDVAIDLNNLGLVLRDQGDQGGAKAAHKRALKIAEAAYGPDHPDVVKYRENLAAVLSALGGLDGA